MAPNVEPLALSPSKAAALLSVSLRTMHRLISSRKVLARKIGARVLVDVASVKAFYSQLPERGKVAPLFVHPVTGRRHRRKGSRS